MVYPFENAAFNTPVGKVSMPIRSRFGYHIVKVNDKRPSVGQVRTAHIMIANPPENNEEQRKQAKKMIDSVYTQVLNNEDFSKLAMMYSQDPGSAKNGGELNWFGTGRMVPEFEQVAFALENPGQVSKPIQTRFGWHIIKLLEKKKTGTFEEMLPEIKSKFARDERGRISQAVFIEQVKDKQGFKLDSAAFKTIVALLDSSLYVGKWQMPAQYKNQFLFGFADKTYTLNDLSKRIANNQKQLVKVPFTVIVEKFFNDLVSEAIIAFEENRLITENTELYYLMKEYHDGILLFEIMEQNVWAKSSSDFEGLEKFYSENIKDYMWDRRVHSLVYKTKDKKIAKKAFKLITKKKGAKLTQKEFESKFAKDSDTLLTIHPFAATPDNLKLIGYETWENGLSAIKTTDEGYEFIRFIKLIEDEPKPLADIKGQVIADYQEYLEKEWIKSLREKHSIVVNDKVFQEIVSSLN
jgi:peptidyl-prolyl cis-trans isomerase SurA